MKKAFRSQKFYVLRALQSECSQHRVGAALRSSHVKTRQVTCCPPRSSGALAMLPAVITHHAMTRAGATLLDKAPFAT